MGKAITIGSFIESLTRHFPGVIPQTGSSLNGEVASITFWEFHVHGSLTTKKVSHSDVPGEILLTFNQKPDGRRPVKRKELRTSNPEEMEQFVETCHQWVTGVLHVLTVAFEPRDEHDPEILPGLAGLLERRP